MGAIMVSEGGGVGGAETPIDSGAVSSTISLLGGGITGKVAVAVCCCCIIMLGAAPVTPDGGGTGPAKTWQLQPLMM